MSSKNMNEGLLESFNKVEKIHWWWEGRRELLKLFLTKTRPKKILDIGCGTGETLTFLKTIFPNADLFGIDYSSKAVKFSKDRGHKNIFKAGANKLPFKKNTFDVILFLDVLEHIDDDFGAIKEAKRVLKSGGKIIITGPSLNFIWSDHDTNQGHKRRYSRKDLKKLCFDSDLNLKFLASFNFFLSFPIIIIRLLSRIKPLRSFANYSNSLNYDIAYSNPMNSLLKYIFVKEVCTLKYIRYPFGISVSAVYTKK